MAQNVALAEPAIVVNAKLSMAVAFGAEASIAAAVSSSLSSVHLSARLVGSECRYPTRMQKLAFQASLATARNNVYVGICAGFSDAASERLNQARCLSASEKRQGSKSRGRCAEGSGSPMGN